jgi:hypothetical protein
MWDSDLRSNVTIYYYMLIYDLQKHVRESNYLFIFFQVHTNLLCFYQLQKFYFPFCERTGSAGSD